MILFSCNQNSKIPDGIAIERSLLSVNNLSKDFANTKLLKKVIADVNCAIGSVFNKRLVFANDFYSSDSSLILVIAYSSNGPDLTSSAYSNIKNRYILINPDYIREFALNNTLNDTTAYEPLLELMLLHEIGHFIINKSGAFDVIQQPENHISKNNTNPEYLTIIKKLELSADSIAISLVNQALSSKIYNCSNIGFSVQRIVPGIEFRLAMNRILENFGNSNTVMLHDPSPTHPNIELRITFMNYFLFPNDSIRQNIDDYLYNRTIGSVYRQQYDPRIYQKE